MRFKIITSDKIHAKYTKEAIQEYGKRLTRYCKIELVEAMLPEKIITDKSYVIAIDSNGEQLYSEGLAEKFSSLSVSGISDIVILVGHDNYQKIDYRLSISKMKFDVDILMIVLYEQIYRAYRIISNQPYHK